MDYEEFSGAAIGGWLGSKESTSGNSQVPYSIRCGIDVRFGGSLVPSSPTTGSWLDIADL